MKLTVVGGGSTYTPELADGIGRLTDVLSVDELVLVDPAVERTATVAAVSQRILDRLGAPVHVRATSSLDEGIDGASAVLLQLRVGGQDARANDESFPLACGCVGQETTGAGGLAKAVRTVPVVLEIAERIRARDPATWIVDFTNPVGIVTRALLDAGHRAVGLCNVAIGFQRWLADLLGVTPERIDLGHVGLNHLSWERSVRLDGTDVLPGLLRDHLADVAARVEMPADLITLIAAIPSYYLRYYYQHDEVVREQLDTPSRAQVVAAIESELLALYADPGVDRKPDLLTQRGGAYYSEAAVALVASLLGAAPGRHVVNVRNEGRLPNLPDEAVVEVAVHVASGEFKAVDVDPLPPLEAGLVAHVSAYEELALDAARLGGAHRIRRALLAHPLVGQYEKADRLTAALLRANTRFLASK
jgi:6-phospho-beta-glucosidase